MSAAIRLTDGAARRDFMTETAAGPPAPVTRTRTLRSGTSGTLTCGMRHLRVGVGCADRLGWAAGLAVGGGLADRLERLGVAAVAKPRPVPGGRLDQIGLQVAPDLHLG